MLVRVFSGLAAAALAVGFLAAGAPAQATPEYAKKEMQKCSFCHVAPGKERNFRGLYYIANGKSFASFDEKFEAKAAGVKEGSMGPEGLPTVAGYPKETTAAVPASLKFTMKDIDGKPVNLGRYAGEVLLVTNVASKCGNTPQYAALQKLYDKYKEKGFTVLGFPANEFGGQEPGTEKEIKEFCTSTYKVTFPMFSKVVVKGEGQAPLYKYLTSKETNPKFGGDIEWNFAKFLVNRKGEVIARIPARTSPDSPEVVALIEKALAAK
jgi:glutathione peroxidase